MKGLLLKLDSFLPQSTGKHQQEFSLQKGRTGSRPLEGELAQDVGFQALTPRLRNVREIAGNLVGIDTFLQLFRFGPHHDAVTGDFVLLCRFGIR